MKKLLAKIPKLTQTQILLTVFGLLLILIFGRFISLLSFSDSQIQLEKGPLLEMKKSETVQQKFLADRSGLDKISILLRSPGIKSGDQVEIKLLDENCQQILRQGFLQDAFVDSQNLYDFQFSKLKNSANQNFCLEMNFQTNNPTAKPIRFFTAEQNHYFDFSAENVTTGEKSTSHLSLRPSYRQGFFQNISELNQRISQYKAPFLKHNFLWIISIAFLALSITLVILLMRI